MLCSPSPRVATIYGALVALLCVPAYTSTVLPKSTKPLAPSALRVRPTSVLSLPVHSTHSNKVSVLFDSTQNVLVTT